MYFGVAKLWSPISHINVERMTLECVLFITVLMARVVWEDHNAEYMNGRNSEKQLLESEVQIRTKAFLKRN